MQIIGDNVFIIFVRHIFINDMLKPEMFPNFNECAAFSPGRSFNSYLFIIRRTKALRRRQ